MSEDESDPIRQEANEKNVGLAKASNNRLIFRIYPMLRRENERAYEPEMLSIGPYHRGKENLQMMEMYKLKYLEKLLKRRGESDEKRYITALTEAEEEARNYYAGISLIGQADDFVRMMLLDGCFIIELLRKLYYGMNEEEEKDDPIDQWLASFLCRDLLLFENQLPFFVLDKLFDMTKIPGLHEDLIHLAISCLHPIFPTDHMPPKRFYGVGEQKILHLLDLMYWSSCSAFVGRRHAESQGSKRTWDYENENLYPAELMKSAGELKEHGIEFRKAKQSESLLDIKFQNGVMEIPPLNVDYLTETILRNLIAYEQHMRY